MNGLPEHQKGAALGIVDRENRRPRRHGRLLRGGGGTLSPRAPRTSGGCGGRPEREARVSRRPCSSGATDPSIERYRDGSWPSSPTAPTRSRRRASTKRIWTCHL